MWSYDCYDMIWTYTCDFARHVLLIVSSITLAVLNTIQISHGISYFRRTLRFVLFPGFDCQINKIMAETTITQHSDSIDIFVVTWRRLKNAICATIILHVIRHSSVLKLLLPKHHKFYTFKSLDGITLLLAGVDCGLNSQAAHTSPNVQCQ